MQLRWTMPTANDLEEIRKFLEQYSPQIAELTVRTIYRRIQSLKTAPAMGRPGLREGTRELVLAPLPYIVVYSLRVEAVEILHIYHGSQDWRSGV